ncbi:MAG: hypothetical protein KF895_03000 [Parvibaculum sp.]|nr:hypothetical protein [Parvibaculum sp.]
MSDVSVESFREGLTVDVPASGGDGHINFEDTPIPDGMPVPFGWRIFVMPVKPRAVSQGGILLPEQVMDAQSIMTFVGRICAIGPAAFKHKKYADLGMTEADFPKVGDLVMYNRSTPNQWEFKGVKLVTINDDHILGRAETARGFKIYI